MRQNNKKYLLYKLDFAKDIREFIIKTHKDVEHAKLIGMSALTN